MRVSKDAWQNLGLAALIAITLAGVVWLFGTWPPQPPASGIQPVRSQPATSPSDQAPAEPVAAFLGDSYTEGTGASSTSHRWTTLVADEMGWQEVNLGQGGTGYSTAGTVEGRQPYPARAGNVAADVIVVAGGQNDYGQPTAKILRGIDSTFQQLRKHNPQARIIAVSPTAPNGGTPSQLVRMRDEIQQQAKRVDAEFVDATTPPWFGDPGLLAQDGVHPNNRGHALYARKLVAELR